jgi:hypothetical protein
VKQTSVAQDAERDAIRLKERAERYSLRPDGVKPEELKMRNFSFLGVFSAASQLYPYLCFPPCNACCLKRPFSRVGRCIDGKPQHDHHSELYGTQKRQGRE